MVFTADGRPRTLTATIDTGFNGFLTRSSQIIDEPGLSWHALDRAERGDGSIHVFDIYTARISWDGQDRLILVDAADTAPLRRMAMLHGYQLVIDVIEGGRLTVTER